MYFKHIPSLSFFEEHKQDEFSTWRDFESFLAEMNSKGSVPSLKNFTFNVTRSYVQVVCGKCKVFSYWLQNKKKKVLSEMLIVGPDKKVEEKAPAQLVFGRSINFNH